MNLNTKSDRECTEISQKKRSLTNPKFESFDHSIFTIGDRNDFSLYIYYFLYQVFDSIVDIQEVRQTFEYIFKYIKKGHFVFFGNECEHIPLSNYYFVNPYFENLFIDDKDKRYLKKLKFLLENIKSNNDIKRYFYLERKSNQYVFHNFFKTYNQSRNIFYERRQWVSNGCFFRMEKYEGDKFYNLYDYFFKTLHKEIKRSNDSNKYLFFANIRDFPILRKDGRYPYTNCATSEKLDIYPALPVFSLCSTLEHRDIPMPTPDDLHFIYEDTFFPPLLCSKVDKELIFDWNKKKGKVVFRGSATGCSIDLKNARLLGYNIARQNKDMFDYGITNFNRRIKKETPESNISYLQVRDLKESGKLTAREISGYKFILVLEGHVAAFRLSYNLYMKSCVLLQESKYLLWYSRLLKPYEHYVPIKNDLSDLVEKAQWCIDNDKKCEEISQNGYHLIKKVLTKKFIYEYMHENLKRFFIYEPRSIPISEKRIALITIYRDSSKSGYRRRQKEKFVDYFRKIKNIDIYIIEQSKEHEFNIGLLKNIGFYLASLKRNTKYDHFIFSDIDLLPDDELMEYYMNPKMFPLSLAYRGTIYESFDPSEYIRMYENNSIFYNKKYFFIGGVCVFDKETFINVNGYPNCVWGWGGEDEVLLYRIYQRYGKMFYPKKGRVIDLEENNFNIKKKRSLQKRENEETNMLKYELLDKYSNSDLFKKDGVENVKNYFKVVSSKKIYSNVKEVKVELNKLVIEKVSEAGKDYKRMYYNFRTKIKDLIYKFI